MDLKISEFYYDLAIKKYYKASNELFDNIIEQCYRNNNPLFFKLIGNNYDRNIVCETINKWIDKLNKESREKWYGFAHEDIHHISNDMAIVECFRDINYLLLANIKNLSDEQLISYIYLYCGFNLYYDGFCNNIIINQTKLKENYDGIIFDKDYTKWALIPISDDRKFLDNRIFDEKNNKTIHICLKKELLNIFHEMIENGLIGKISFRSNDIIENGLIKDNSLCEAVEKGTIFNLKVTGLCNETKLYSEKNYNDQLWVFKDDNSIIFEELLDDFEYYDEDIIVTQMVHLEYFVEDNVSFISHIDKENIFYTFEEYNKRFETNIKGNAKKRVKFFKINDSKIRFDYPCSIIINTIDKTFEEKNVPFIYYIIRHFFKNKEIVDEYFAQFNK